MALIALVLAACGDDPTGKSTEQVTAGENLLVLSGSVERTDKGLTGNATLAGSNNLVHELNKFALAFYLEDGGSITLLANGGEGLANAAEIKLVRNGNKITQAVASAAGATITIEVDFDATGLVEVNVEVHQEGATHIIVYPKNGAKNEGEELGELTGRTWGLKLANATLASVAVSEAQED